MNNYYVRLALVVMIVLGAAQVAPEVVNTLLVLILISLLILQSGQFAGLISKLNLN
jgi:hypothetical protein